MALIYDLYDPNRLVLEVYRTTGRGIRFSAILERFL